jgi:excisionase family DNA binding protein
MNTPQDPSSSDVPVIRRRRVVPSPDAQTAAASLPERDAEPLVEEDPDKKKLRRNRAPTNPDFQPERIVLTIKEAASAMGVAPSFIERAVRHGTLRISRLTPQIIRILPEELREWALRTRVDLSSENEIPEDDEG